MPDIIKSKAITLIRVRDGEMEFATTITERREWLADRRRDDILGAAWPGAWSTHVFEVPTQLYPVNA